MQYRLLGEDIYGESKNFLKTILKRRGVEDVDRLIHLSKDEVHSPYLLDGMEEGIACLDKHLRLGSTIKLIMDDDFDGISSASLFYNYLNENLDTKCEFIVHNGKKHGIIVEELKNSKFDLLVVPDGGTSDLEAMNELKEINPNLDILILDHHSAELQEVCNVEGKDELVFFKDVSKEDIKAKKFSNKRNETLQEFLDRNPSILINPHTCNYPNKNIAGVGVVYKFLEALDEAIGIDVCRNYLDLVACGNVADSMDLRELETRYYVMEGIKLLEEDKVRYERGLPTKGNSYLRAFVDLKKERDLANINIKDIGWKIAPQINGAIRMGSVEDKRNLFRAFIGEVEPMIYQPRRPNGSPKDSPKPDPIEQTLQQGMIRKCASLKSKQDTATRKAKEKIEEVIINQGLNNEKIIMVDATDLVTDKSLTGLIANKLASTYKKPILMLKSFKKDLFGGSGRNYSKSPIGNLRQFLLDLDVFDKCAG